MEQEGKMTGMSVFRDEKAVKSSPKSEKSFKNSEKLAVKSNFFAIFAFRKQCSGLSLAFSTGGCERKVRAA